MGWQDRLREGAYTSPSGLRFPFSTEDVEHSIEKLGTAFNFSGRRGTVVQDRGLSNRTFPMKLFLHGTDYDLLSDAFLTALTERGIGTLEHPIYGKAKVVPLGKIKREDKLKTAGNQAIFEVIFVETLSRVYPSATADNATISQANLDMFYEKAAISFDDGLELDSAIENVSLKNGLLAQIKTIAKELEALGDNIQLIQAKANSIVQDAVYLVSKPFTLAFQTLNLLATPSLLLQKVKARVRGYFNILDRLLGFDFTPSIDGRSTNNYRYQDLLVTGVLSSIVIVSVNREYTTRAEAQLAALDLLNGWEAYLAWKDAQIESLDLIDTGESQQALMELVSGAASTLVSRSFELRTEVEITLAAPRTIIDLCAEYYGSVEDNLDFFISSNNLSVDNIIKLERGDNVVYYI